MLEACVAYALGAGCDILLGPIVCVVDLLRAWGRPGARDKTLGTIPEHPNHSAEFCAHSLGTPQRAPVRCDKLVACAQVGCAGSCSSSTSLGAEIIWVLCARVWSRGTCPGIFPVA